MRLFRTRFHEHLSVVLLVCLLITGIVILLFPREGVAQASFEKIEIGMSLDEVQRLLGPPDLEWIDSGLQREMGWYTLDCDPKRLREDRYRNTTRQLWSSPELTIVVISNFAGRVACRGFCGGRKRDNAFVMLWYLIKDRFF
jgi:hypothetical protein